MGGKQPKFGDKFDLIATLTNLSNHLKRGEEVAIKDLSGSVMAIAKWTKYGPKICIFGIITPNKSYHATARIKYSRDMPEHTMIPGRIHVGMNVYMALDNDGCLANALLQANLS
jgi:hypothetical protein